MRLEKNLKTSNLTKNLNFKKFVCLNNCLTAKNDFLTKNTTIYYLI